MFPATFVSRQIILCNGKKYRCVKTEILSSLVIWYLLFLSFHLELLFPGLCDMKFFYYLCERMYYCIAQGVYNYSN